MGRVVWIVILLFASNACWAVKGKVTSHASVVVHHGDVVCPLKATLFGSNVLPTDRAIMVNPEVVERIRRLGIRSCRFPNGCVADQYNWKSPKPGEATVDEFLDFCDAIYAEPYYTINMQGGTEGKALPIPEDASLDERIKYRHVAPNPCGYTQYHFGTLAEAVELVRKYTVERALAGKNPILAYEMGNENWGQSKTDWPPAVYARTIEVYANAMRKVLDDAKKDHPELERYKLDIIAVGFPVMGNNMKMTDTPDRRINLEWTGLLNYLHKRGVVDSVQEHYYPYASANGGALVWVAHNLNNILMVRRGLPNPRLNNYADPEIAYNMPIEFTEWNVKCWGEYYSAGVQLKNPGFEDGTTGWECSDGYVRSVSWAARRGDKGLRVCAAKEKPCEISQMFDVPENTHHFVGAVWVRTAKPGAVKISFVQANDGENKGKVLGGCVSKLTNTWEHVILSAVIKPDTKKLKLVMQVNGSESAYLDEAKLYYAKSERGNVPLSAMCYEQVLFCVDALMMMATNGSPRAHIHHLVGDYPCGMMSSSGEFKDLSKAFIFFNDAYGDVVTHTEVKCDSFGYYTAANPWATDFNALAPDQSSVPMLAAMSSRSGDNYHVLLLNRSSDRTLDVSVDLNNEPAEVTARVRTLSGEDIDLPGATITESEIPAARKFNIALDPYTAKVVTVRCR